MLSERDKARIAAQESAAFLDANFGQLDLSGSPDLRPLPNDKFEAADSHGLSNVVVSGSNKLKELADNPDSELLSRIAEETGDPELAEKITEERELGEARAFMASTPSYYRDDGNYAALRHYLDDRNLRFTAANLKIAFTALSRAGELVMRPGHAKRLTDSEQLHVIALCKNAQLEDAVSQYLDYALPDADEQWSDSTAFLTDPATVSVRNQACYFVWYHSRPVQDTPEFREYAKSFFRSRPIHTIADLDDCYAAFEAHSREGYREEIIRGTEPPPVSPDSLEELSDEQVQDLTRQTLQARARQIRRRRV
jgi:hypothetical protein